MALNETDLQLLEDFWNGRLDAPAKAALEKRLQEDTIFSQAADDWKFILEEGFQAPREEQQEIIDIKRRLLDYVESPSEKEEGKVISLKPKRRLFVRRASIGLGIAATILLLLWLSPLNNLLFPSDPYEQYFTHLPRDNANLSLNIEEGRQAYDQKNYNKAYPALMAEVEAGGDSLNLIYASVAAIGSGQADKAVAILEPLVGDDGWTFYQEEVMWYLALAYLKIGEKENAVEILRILNQEEGSPYKDQVKSLINQLRK